MKRFYAAVVHALFLALLCSVSFGQSPQNTAPNGQQSQNNQPQPQANAPTKESAGPSSNVNPQAKSPSSPAAQTNAASLVKPDNWQCLLYATYFNIWRLEIVVTSLSTYRLQNCSTDGMDKLTVASAEAQLRTVAKFDKLLKGGAHQQVMNVNLTPIDSEYYTVSNLKFSPIATVRIDLETLFATTRLTGVSNLLAANYRPFVVQGKMYYIWNIGTLVHRLVSPDGDTYLMSSFTTEVAPTLTRDRLVYLGDMLNLPEGWEFESYFLDKTITIRAGPDNNNSIVQLFDDLHNNYVKYRE
jgi:hypothetical protein